MATAHAHLACRRCASRRPCLTLFAVGVVLRPQMTLPLDAAGSRAEVAAMTTLMLGVGYSISACAPAVPRAVRDAAGSFTAPLALLAADALALLVVTLLMPARMR